MKAALLYGPRDIRIEDLPEPGPPGPGEALVEVRAVGLCGSDLHYWTDGRIGDTVLAEPFIIGHEPSGIVREVGPGVTSLRPGARVAIDPALPCGECDWCQQGHPNLCPHVRFFGTPPTQGALRERLVHPVEGLLELPATMTLADGALCEALGVALHAVDLGHVRTGTSAVVLGCGSIGLLCLQVLRCAGATALYAIDLEPARLELAKQFGAAAVCCAAETDPVAWLADQTGGRGVETVLESATSCETQLQATAMARIGGRVVLVGIPPADEFTLCHSVARRRGLTIAFARRMKHVYRRALQLASTGAIDLPSVTTHRAPLAEVAAAFDLVEHRRDGVVKCVIEVPG